MYAVIWVAPPRRVVAVGIPSLRGFIDFMDMPSLLRQAYERFQPFIPGKRICVLAHKCQVKWILSELPELPHKNLWLLPGYQTPMVQIGWAALRLWQKEPDALMVVMPENHLLDEEAQASGFCHLLKVGEFIVRRWDALVTFGTAITSPKAVGAGDEWIRVDDQAPAMECGVGVALPVKQFLDSWELRRVESGNREWTVRCQVALDPNASGAKGAFFRNRHTYLWRVSTFLEHFRVHQPAVFEGVKQLHGSLGTALDEDVLWKRYTALPKISLEEGILAHTPNVWLVGTQMGWEEIHTIADLIAAFGKWGDEAETCGLHSPLSFEEVFMQNSHPL